MRRRVVPPPPGASAVPLEIGLGPCVEVWGDRPMRVFGDAASFEARRNYGRARDLWHAASGLTAEAGWRLVPSRAPWSITSGQSLDRHLNRLGVEKIDVDSLRAAARNWRTS